MSHNDYFDDEFVPALAADRNARPDPPATIIACPLCGCATGSYVMLLFEEAICLDCYHTILEAAGLVRKRKSKKRGDLTDMID